MQVERLNQKGLTLLELLACLALVTMVFTFAGLLRYRFFNHQRSLLFTGQQLAADVRAAVSIARSRGITLVLEVSADRYRIYRETSSPANGWQEGEEIIFEVPFKDGITLASTPAVPQAWGNPDDPDDMVPLAAGSLVTIAPDGIPAETVIMFHDGTAPAFQNVCVHIFLSADSEVVRSDEHNNWVAAPVG